MTIEQVKEEAKKRFDREITDEVAQAWLDARKTGELQDSELENVTGGGCYNSDGYLIVTGFITCEKFEKVKDLSMHEGSCLECKYCDYRKGLYVCTITLEGSPW